MEKSPNLTLAISVTNLQSQDKAMPVWFVICQSWLNPNHLWKAWCTQGQPEMCQLKPRHNLRDLMRPAIFQLLLTLPQLFRTASLTLFFLIRRDFYQPPPVSNRYRLWNFRRQSVWEPQYQLCSSHPAPLQTRGRFLKRWEKLHKERIWDWLNTNWQWKYFHTLFNLFFMLPPFSLLVYFSY